MLCDKIATLRQYGLTVIWLWRWIDMKGLDCQRTQICAIRRCSQHPETKDIVAGTSQCVLRLGQLQHTGIQVSLASSELLDSTGLIQAPAIMSTPPQPRNMNRRSRAWTIPIKHEHGTLMNRLLFIYWSFSQSSKKKLYQYASLTFNQRWISEASPDFNNAFDGAA